MGYNCVQLMAVAEHAHYGCFGYHVPWADDALGRRNVGPPLTLCLLVYKPQE